MRRQVVRAGVEPGAAPGTVDVLTGLSSRWALRDPAARPDWIHRAHLVSVGVSDLEGFGGIVDAHGFDVGDAILRDLARRLQQEAGWPNWLLRLGDDEFAVILPSSGDEDAAERAHAELIARVLRRPFRAGDRVLQVHAATGVAVGEPARLVDLVRLAGMTARHLGPTQVSVYRPLPSKEVAGAALEADLRHGLEAGEIAAFYQPVIDLDAEHVVGAEALVRWRHPIHGLLRPEEFIPVMEARRTIGVIDLAMIRRSAAQMIDLTTDRRCGDLQQIAVNVSTRQLVDPGFPRAVAEVLDESGLPPDRLELELTETALVNDPETARRASRELHRLGVGLVVDDFGTGYAPLAYVQQFPVTALKIDRSFVERLGSSGRDAAIVASIIALSEDMGLKVVAEGVETTAQLAALRALGCHYAQGFLWSAAVPAADFGEVCQRLDARRWDPPLPRPVTGTEERASLPGRRIATLYAAGASASTIAAALNKAGLLTPEGRRWTKRTVEAAVRDLTRPATGQQ